MPEEEVRGGVRKGPATAYKKSELGAVMFPVRPVCWQTYGSFAEEGTGEAFSGSWQGVKGSGWDSRLSWVFDLGVQLSLVAGF